MSQVYTFTITATDSSSPVQTASKEFTLLVDVSAYLGCSIENAPNITVLKSPSFATVSSPNQGALVTDIAFAPDGTYMAVARKDGTIRVYGLPNFNLAYTIPAPTGFVTAGAYVGEGVFCDINPTSDFLAATYRILDGGDNSSSLVLYETSSSAYTVEGSRVAGVESFFGRVKFSPDGAQILTTHAVDPEDDFYTISINAFAADFSLTLTKEALAPSQPFFLTFQPRIEWDTSGQYALVNNQGQPFRYDYTANTFLSSPFGNNIVDFAFSDDGTTMVTAASSNWLTFYTLSGATWTFTTSAQVVSGLRSVAYFPASSNIAVGTNAFPFVRFFRTGVFIPGVPSSIQQFNTGISLPSACSFLTFGPIL